MTTPLDESSKPLGKDLSGTQIGDYQLLRRLGQGAMAEVYLAEQCSLKRQVALKILRDDLTGDETYVKRFRREAEAAASLVHASIVQIHEVGCIDGVYFIAQEYVEGQNLRHWISRHDHPDLAQILSIMCQVTAALVKAAARGIVHRDIKPENILLTRLGEVKVADFGLARSPRQSDGVELTRVGITLGTPLYMSPEQVEGRPLDPRSDLYSFGVTCYHLLSGSPPFSGETPLSVAVQHLKKEPKSLATLRGDLPAELCRLIHRMLAKDPKDRPQSARELLQELRQIQRQHLGEAWPEDLPGWDVVGLEDQTLGPVQATQRIQAVMDTTALERPRRRSQMLWAAAAIGVFLVGGLLAWQLTRPTSVLAEASTSAAAPVPPQDTVVRQTIQAARLGTLPAWQAVIDRFPKETNYVLRAKQQIARIHLRAGNDADAMPVFEGLAQTGLANAELRAFGLAGQVVLLNRDGKFQQSDALYQQQLKPLLPSLKDRALYEAVESAERKNRQELAKLAAS